MKLVSWNINGFRSICEKPAWQWFYNTDADIVSLQETKADTSQIPVEHLNPQGWRSFWLPSTIKKGYSGVALFIRESRASKLLNMDMELDGFEGEGRLNHAEFPEFHFFNVYFPNGGASDERLKYKMAYYDAFLMHAEILRQSKPIVVCGDFNTAHKPIDLEHPDANRKNSGFLPMECAWMDKLVDTGYVDTFRFVHGDMKKICSWWSYKTHSREKNVGWRIDYFFISNELIPKLADAWIDINIMGSDHCPVGLELNL